MKSPFTTHWKKLLGELDLAQQAFNASHARLSQSLRASEAGKKPEQPLGQCLQQHLTATSCLLAMGRAAVNYRQRLMAPAGTEGKRRRGPVLSGA
jgi:hypothetical protein